MSFIRPELQQRIWRWREVLVGAFVACCGMYWAVSQNGVLAIVGTCLAIVGALITFAGFQRTRFRVGAGGPGVVHIDERQVTYYGPHDGGSISIDALTSVVLDPAAKPYAVWSLTDLHGLTVDIPTHAENAEALFDVFSALDGIETENMLSQLRSNPDKRVRIWHAGQRRLH
ncbi:hypothetical protein P1J78_17825 [Psychromarinibacter sp. C21-152]|uniref:Uncharacterized protein n=1 Tax=Psychromarinibacter sediminicola TaxID=3033385 RepID=A0AAE3NUM8_9RHOB|nr:hypothetical protein [Psychromarinibacter sediminicola]MDF0602601.1 hypothetical protein [Psychromarinibacter sediminicola]